MFPIESGPCLVGVGRGRRWSRRRRGGVGGRRRRGLRGRRARGRSGSRCCCRGRRCRSATPWGREVCEQERSSLCIVVISAGSIPKYCESWPMIHFKKIDSIELKKFNSSIITIWFFCQKITENNWFTILGSWNRSGTCYDVHYSYLNSTIPKDLSQSLMLMALKTQSWEAIQ